MPGATQPKPQPSAPSPLRLSAGVKWFYLATAIFALALPEMVGALLCSRLPAPFSLVYGPRVGACSILPPARSRARDRSVRTYPAHPSNRAGPTPRPGLTGAPPRRPSGHPTRVSTPAASAPQTLPKTTPRNLKSFLEETLIARETTHSALPTLAPETGRSRALPSRNAPLG